MKKTKPPPIVLVEWIDCHSPARQRWTPTDEIAGREPHIVGRSVGFLVRSDKDCVVILPHVTGEWGDEDDLVQHGMGELYVTRAQVRKITYLRR